jgi:hypothetical protein
MLRTILALCAFGSLTLVPLAWSGVAATGSPPAVTGPLTAAADNGCRTDRSCSYDFELDPSTTDAPSTSWHAFWETSPPSTSTRAGWCTTEVTDLISWGAAGSATLPSRTYPDPGTTIVGPTGPAVLDVDAAGHAKTPGELTGTPSWPKGMATTRVGHGYMSVVWQGRTTRPMPLLLAAEVPNPGSQAQFIAGLNTASLGVPCAHVAPPGPTFLARVRPSTVRSGQTAWLELRIPRTAYRWTVTPKQLSVQEGSGVATVSVAYDGDGFFGRGKASKPEKLGVSDRYSLPLRERLRDRYLIRVTLRGPTGVRHYKLHLMVR